MLRATRIEARVLRRSALAGDSAMSITSGASMTRRRVVCIGMSRELGANQISAADQVDTEAEIPSGRDGAIDRMSRRMIATHRINRNPHVDANRCLIGV